VNLSIGVGGVVSGSDRKITSDSKPTKNDIPRSPAALKVKKQTNRYDYSENRFRFVEFIQAILA
jgi:hypothetical protein